MHFQLYLNLIKQKSPNFFFYLLSLLSQVSKMIRICSVCLLLIRPPQVWFVKRWMQIVSWIIIGNEIFWNFMRLVFKFLMPWIIFRIKLSFLWCSFLALSKLKNIQFGLTRLFVIIFWTFFSRDWLSWKTAKAKLSSGVFGSLNYWC